MKTKSNQHCQRFHLKLINLEKGTRIFKISPVLIIQHPPSLPWSPPWLTNHLFSSTPGNLLIYRPQYILYATCYNTSRILATIHLNPFSPCHGSNWFERRSFWNIKSCCWYGISVNSLLGAKCWFIIKMRGKYWFPCICKWNIPFPWVWLRWYEILSGVLWT